MKSIFEEKAENISLGKLISIINRYYGINLDKKSNISRGQIPFLIALLDKNNVSQEYLAELFNMNEGTVARALYKLEENNLICRKIDKKNKRKKLITLTENGIIEAAKFKKIDKLIEKKLFESMTTNDIKKSKIFLKKIAINAINLTYEDF